VGRSAKREIRGDANRPWAGGCRRTAGVDTRRTASTTLPAPVAEHPMTGCGGGMITARDDQFAATQICERGLDGAL